MKHLFRTIAVLCLTILGSTAAKADTDYALQILLSDNSTITCAFAKQPQMTFDNGVMTLTTSESTIGSWEFSGVRKWTFITIEPDAVKNVEASRQLTIRDNVVTISGHEGTQAAVYDTAGRLHLSVPVSGETQLSLSSLPAGVYILKVDNRSLKFTVK